MKDRHFEQLSAQTGIQMALTPTMTFKSLLMLGIEQFEELVKIVADTAAKEYATERTLNKMIAEWETVVMEILPYKATGEYSNNPFVRLISLFQHRYNRTSIQPIWIFFDLCSFKFWVFKVPREIEL